MVSISLTGHSQSKGEKVVFKKARLTSDGVLFLSSKWILFFMSIFPRRKLQLFSLSLVFFFPLLFLLQSKRQRCPYGGRIQGCVMSWAKRQVSRSGGETMEGNGTETKYMLNSAICGQNRPSPLKGPMQSENMTLPRKTLLLRCNLFLQRKPPEFLLTWLFVFF